MEDTLALVDSVLGNRNPGYFVKPHYRRNVAEPSGIYVIVLPIENSPSCTGKWLYDNRVWFCSRESTTLQGYTTDQRCFVF
jgi:hypothetical protein